MITKNNPLHKEGMAIKGIAELLNCKKNDQNGYEKSLLFSLSSILYVKITSVIYKRYIFAFRQPELFTALCFVSLISDQINRTIPLTRSISV